MNLVAENLLHSTEVLVKNEKAFTFKIIKNLCEIDKQKLYVELGYNSLFTYCRDHLKYSDQEATLRVNAVRLIKHNRLAEIKLEKNELSLTVASDLFVNMKKYNECNETKLTVEEKNSLIAKTCNESSRVAKKIIQQELKLVPEVKTELKLKKATAERLEKLKEKLGIQDIDLFLNHLMQEKEDSLKKEETTRAQLSQAPKKSRYIPVQTKRKLFKEAHYQCEFRNSNGTRCSSRVHLQVEHIEPYSLGGSNQRENLKILCQTHNHYNAIKIFGYKKLELFYANNIDDSKRDGPGLLAGSNGSVSSVR